MMRFGSFGFNGGMNYGWGWIMMFGLLLLVIVGVILIVKHSHNSVNTSKTYGSANVAPSAALEILNERYARGEISSEEYNKIKSDILK